ncbi:glutamine amidotransferase class-II [Paraburkholderia sp. EG287A]|uniref:glutamine amidotransferase class-II n=1 Tax=unclassified Paraburkholderia TaxID=2615204 RepID=UPI0034D30349
MAGIAAAFKLPDSVSDETVLSRLGKMAAKLANRGQCGADLLVFMEKTGTTRYRSNCLPSKYIPIEQSEYSITISHPASVGLAHIHSHTPVKSDPSNVQPRSNSEFNHNEKNTFISISLNGALANGHDLKDELQKHGILPRGNDDAEIFMRFVELICRRDYWKFGEPINYKKVFREIDLRIDGAVSALLLDGHGNLVAYRNQGGIRPLDFMTTTDKFILFASENGAFIDFDGEYEEVLPSHIKVIDAQTGLLTDHFVGDEKHPATLCAFESIYIGNLETKNKNQCHESTRYKIGSELSELVPQKIGYGPHREKIIISSMPDTGRPYADGLFSQLSKKDPENYERAEVVRLNLSQRTLISDAHQRKSLINQKYQVIDVRVSGRMIVIVDEALIRADTSKDVTQKLIDAGASGVHWVIGSPPIIAPNYYGVGIQHMEELAFWKIWRRLPDHIRQCGLSLQNMDPSMIRIIEQEIALFIKAGSVTYLPLRSLIAVLPGADDCNDLSPFTLRMPTQSGLRMAARNFHKIVVEKTV